MFRTPVRKRRTHHNGLASSLALALALAGGTAVGMASFAAPAFAAKKDKKDEQAKPKYTKEFVETYQPVEKAFKEAKDEAGWQAIRPLIQPMLDKITNDDERFAAGGMVIQLGIKLNDQELQRQGLVLQLDSGKVPEDRLAQYNYFAGGIYFQDKKYEDAKKYLTAAFNKGYTGDDIESLIATSYFEQDQVDQGLAEIKRMEQVREAAGSQLPEQTLRTGLQAVYDKGEMDKIADWAALVARHYPKPDTWNMTASVVLDSYDLSPDEALDLYRLMRLNNALKTTRDYVDYANAADARRLSNEVLPLLQDGISKGVLKADDVFVKENMAIAVDRAPKDKAEADEIANEGRTAATGIAARAAGDNYMSLGMPAKAVEMYKLAGQKGGVDAERLLMRTGVAEAEAGDYDAARQQFGQVAGKRLPVAKMWLAYVDAKQSPPPASSDAADAPADDSSTS